jgi:uncharacterized protein YigA (DUF484 family)
MTLRKKNKQETKFLSKGEVLKFLANNPELINDNLELFNNMFSLKKNKGNLISFEDIRIKSLINKNNELKNKISEIVKEAKKNKVIQEKLTKFSNEVISYKDINLLIKFIFVFMQEEFPSFDIELRLIKFNGFTDLDKKYLSSGNNLINDIFLEKKPIFVDKNIIKKYSLEKLMNDKNSTIICSLGIEYPIGVIYVKYKNTINEEEYQFDLITSLTKTISYSLEQFIHK